MKAVMKACLELLTAFEPRSIFLGEGVVCEIGRGEENTIVLDDTQVSRNHAMIQRGPGGLFYLTDLGSRNGTLVNRRRVTAPVVLQPGDRIAIGKEEFLFHGPATDPPSVRERGGTVVDISLRLLTVLVVDIRDFTGLSQRLPEARLSRMMSAVFEECGAILDEHAAWGQKYTGDGVMALWLHRRNVPDPRELLDVFASLDGLFASAASLEARFGLDAPIRIGAGVNTGFGCVGNLGSSAASDYTALSDAVNLAFRLESASKDLDCNVVLGQGTYQYLTTHLNAAGLFELRMARLKGYQELTPVYAGARDAVTAVVQTLALKTSEVVTQAAIG